VLAKVDRMSMAHSLEVRSPLLDHRILEFAAGLPASLKMNNRQGKLPLRTLAARRLPPRIHSMPKRGFSIPAARWLRSELKPMAEVALFTRQGIVSQALDPAMLRQVWDQHQDGSRDHSSLIWAVMMLGLWEQHSLSAAGQ
jgi:asparagine synthase (glutamine-hydrolysing)